MPHICKYAHKFSWNYAIKEKILNIFPASVMPIYPSPMPLSLGNTHLLYVTLDSCFCPWILSK